MAPGPMTAATIAQSTRTKYAGALIAIGHGIVEMPLIFLIMKGLGKYLEYEEVKIGIGLVGGAFLVWMGVGMLREMRRADYNPENAYKSGPILTGVILSATNPYFLLWWAIVGLKLIGDAIKLGMLAFVLFAVVHWLCDLVWLQFLSTAANKGSSIMSKRNQKRILGICATALAFFGGKFIYSAAMAWFALSNATV